MRRIVSAYVSTSRFVSASIGRHPEPLLACGGLRCASFAAGAADSWHNCSKNVARCRSANVLLAGHGDVYLVPDGFGMGRKIASYGADDGYSPMANGTYAVEWSGSEPRFTAYGTPANPVGMYPAD